MWKLQNNRLNIICKDTSEHITETFLIPELPIEHAGFRRGRGTRNHIANLRWMMEIGVERITHYILENHGL